MNLPEDVREQLAKAAATHGMWKGPFSHAALGSPFWRETFTVSCEEAWWHEQMADRNHSLMERVVDRLISDWQDLPAGLRKSADAQKVADLFTVCQVFDIYVRELGKIIGPDAVFEEMDELEEAFKLRSFDIAFKEDAKNQPMPLDITKVHEFGALVQKHKMALQYAEVERRKELKVQVEGATLNKLSHDLLDDLKAVQGNSAASVQSFHFIRCENNLFVIFDLILCTLNLFIMAHDAHLKATTVLSRRHRQRKLRVWLPTSERVATGDWNRWRH